MSAWRTLFLVALALLGAPYGSAIDTIRLVWEKDKDSDTARFCIAVLSECLGLIDETGKVVVLFDKPRRDVGDFSEGLMPISDPDTKSVGYINAEGRWAISRRFDVARGFAEGFAIVRTAFGEPWRFLDRQGNLFGPDVEYRLDRFRLGKAPVQQTEDDLAGYADASGKWAISPQFRSAGPFSAEGLAQVRSKEGLWGYVDTRGAYRVQPRFLMTTPFQAGRAAVVEKGPCWLWTDDAHYRELRTDGDVTPARTQPIGVEECEWGLIDTYGQSVSKLRFQQVGELTADGASAKYAERWGLISLDGEWISQPVWDRVGSFSEGLAAVRDYPNGWGYVDRLGILVIARQYGSAGEFSEGLAAVQVGAGETIYIRPDGSRAFNRSFAHGGAFRRGLANVMIREYDTWEYIDQEGRTVFRYTRPERK